MQYANIIINIELNYVKEYTVFKKRKNIFRINKVYNF